MKEVPDARLVSGDRSPGEVSHSLTWRAGYQTTQRRLALKRSLAALGLYPARVRTKSRIQCKVFYEHVLALCRLSLRVRKSPRISRIALRTIQASSMLSGN